jgi:hypothetical protein
MKKPKKISKELQYLENELITTPKQLDREKEKLINQLKQLKKSDLLPELPKKLTLWQRLIKVLMG